MPEVQFPVSGRADPRPGRRRVVGSVECHDQRQRHRRRCRRVRRGAPRGAGVSAARGCGRLVQLGVTHEFIRAHRQPRRRRLGAGAHPAFRTREPPGHRPHRDGDGPDAVAQFGRQRGCAHPAAPSGRARDSSTLIHRLLLLVRTADRDDAGTDSPVRLQVIDSNGQLRMSELITNTQTDTPQDDLERGVSNWYYLPVQTPFTKREIDSAGSVGRIELEILGRDAWLPESLYLFGLDTLSGRPTKLVPLVSRPDWQLGHLSQDETEGSPKLFL